MNGPAAANFSARLDRYLTLAICLVLLIVAVCAFGALCYRLSQYTIDDSYITFRYAANCAAGHGLVFNPGEHPRAEGLTSPLHAIILSLAPLLGFDIVAFAKWLGMGASIVASLFIGATIYSVVRSITSCNRMSASMISCAGVAYYLSNPYVVGNAVSGMETALGAMAYSGFLWLVTRVLAASCTAKFANSLVLGGAGTVVPMFRPEMGLSVVLVLVVVALLARKSRRPFLLSLATFVILGTAYYLLRFAYYQLPLPLPFYMKQGAFELHGLGDLMSYLLHTALLLPLVLLCLAFAVGPQFAERKKPCVYLLAVLVATGVQLAYYTTIDHVMGFGFRFFQPVAVAIISLAFVGSAIIYEVAARSRLKSLFAVPLLYCIFVISCIGTNVSAYRPAQTLMIDWYAAGIPETLKIAQAMKSASPKPGFRIALNDCGMIPFYTEFSTLDLAGLNNRTIALKATAEATQAEIARYQPHLVLLIAKKYHDPRSLYGWERLSHDDMNRLGYEYRGMMKKDRKMLNGEGYHLLVYSSDQPQAQAMLDQLAHSGVLELPPPDFHLETIQSGERLRPATP